MERDNLSSTLERRSSPHPGGPQSKNIEAASTLSCNNIKSNLIILVVVLIQGIVVYVKLVPASSAPCNGTYELLLFICENKLFKAFTLALRRVQL